MSAARCESANWTLATLLGWTELCNAGGALLGRPPAGVPESRGQAQVPNWCGDWNACGALMVEQGVCPVLNLLDKDVVYVQRGREPVGHLVVSEWPTRDHAVRAAIVFAVIGRLRGRVAARLQCQ